MKKNFTLFLLIFTFFSCFTFGQTTKAKIDSTNVREGESVEYCTTHKKLNELLSNPIAHQKYTAYQNEITRKIQSKSGTLEEKSVIYKIPIVFHVLHNGGAENISNQQIIDGLAILNRDFSLQNIDAESVVSSFSGKAVNTGIEFVLASKAPNGATFCGITRTKNSITNDGSDGQKQVDAIIAGNDIYQGQWSGDEYLNVFICGEIGGAAGYTRNPNDDSVFGNTMLNGIWILHNYLGSIGTSSVKNCRTLTHEAGHWLNLSHVWGSNNNPGEACGDDEVTDTPETKGHTTCNLTDATCNSPIIENVENYMEYSYCSKMFTQGQKERMRASLLSSVGGRDNIWKTTNLLNTGINNSNSIICDADFKLNKTIICPGDSITFTDLSFNTPTSWSWVTSGGTPSTSTLKNPTIVYNHPGIYSVTLTSSVNGSSDMETKTNIIEVLSNTTQTLPYFDGFENYSSISNSENWTVNNQNKNVPFKLIEGIGYSSEKCVILANYDESSTEESIDELISPQIDLSNLTTTDKVTLSFKCSYRKKKSNISETLRFMVSTNCGTNWYTRKTLSSHSLSSIIDSSKWTPSSSTDDWLTVHVTSIINSYFTNDFRFKFQFTGNGGNNIYLDDINLYKGEPSDTNVLGIADNKISHNNEIILYPNPTDYELNVRFSVVSDNVVSLQIKDLTGKTCQEQTINAQKGTNLAILITDDLANGMYFLTTKIGENEKTIPFIVR